MSQSSNVLVKRFLCVRINTARERKEMNFQMVLLFIFIYKTLEELAKDFCLNNVAGFVSTKTKK